MCLSWWVWKSKSNMFISARTELDPSSSAAIGVALPWFLLLLDLLRYAVYLLLVPLQCRRPFLTLSQLSCSVFWIRHFATIWVCLARKGRLCLLYFIIGGCGTWICLCWQSVHSSFHTSTNAYTLFFSYLVSRPYASSLGSVLCVGVCFGFIPVRLALKPLVVGIKCIIFKCYILMWLTGSGWCPPQFVCIILYFMFNLFGIV
jgi:hypothetical protein